MGRTKVHKPKRVRQFNPRIVIPDFAMYSWASQAMQYPTKGEPGFRHTVEHNRPDDGMPIDCLLYYAESGDLVGILNHYPVDIPPYEKAGNINLWVHPDAQRMGVGMRLVTEADRRWRIDFNRQQFTEAGAMLARRYLERRGL